MPQNDYFSDMQFPVHGLDQTRGFGDPVPQTSPDLSNVRVFDVLAGRGRGGSRPGNSKFVLAQLPNGAELIQDLNFVVHVDPDAVADDIWDFDCDAGTLPVDPLFADFLDDDPCPSDDCIVTDPDGREIRCGGTGYQIPPGRLLPVITWPQPNSITQGTALSGTQLNAVATDPVTGTTLTGSYTYTPPSGTVLPTGTGQLLRVVFRPTNSDSYRVASKIVTIDVTATGTLIYTPCCPLNGLPTTLTATFSNGSHCAVATGSVSLTYSAVTGKWTGTGLWGSKTVTLSFYCATVAPCPAVGTGCDRFRLDMSWADGCRSALTCIYAVPGSACSLFTPSFLVGVTDADLPACGCTGADPLESYFYATITV